MKRIAAVVSCIAAMTGFIWATPGHAQWIVSDPISEIFQTITEYAYELKELEQEYQSYMRLVDQLQQAKQQFQSITGIRGLGNILIEDYTKISPTSVASALDIMKGSGQSSTFAKQFAQEASQLSQPYFEDVAPEIVADLKQSMEGNAAQKGANASVYQAAVERYQRMDDLRAQIDCTEDLKAIAELQARLQAESMIAENELVKTQAMNSMLTADRDLQRQRALQQEYEVTATAY